VSPTFRDFGLPARLVAALDADGITEPFEIQAATIPHALAGRDLCGQAPTGSGKTLAFGLPLMARVGEARRGRPTGLVLVPTRELAIQVRKAFIPLGRAAWRYVLAVYGGARLEPQIDSLNKGASVVVATPGRLLDLIERGHIRLDDVQVAVVDEADRMADLGFMPDVTRILDQLPQERQLMLWSATLDGDVGELVARYQRDPVRHVVETRMSSADHRIHVVDKIAKVGTAATLVREHGSTVIFTRTRDGAEQLAEQLWASGVRSEAIHGDRSQYQREQALHRFRSGKVDALVATDVAARGIHVDDVQLVIHWDLPHDPKDYIHRSGRTARAGTTGKVVSLVIPAHESRAKRLLRDVGVDQAAVERGHTRGRDRDHDRDRGPSRVRDLGARRPGGAPGRRTPRQSTTSGSVR
jgi:superfamily II DNA/RNA helicase